MRSLCLALVVCCALPAIAKKTKKAQATAKAEPAPTAYTMGKAAHQREDFAAAIPLFEQVLEEHANHEVASYSASLLFDSLNVLGRYEELGKWAERIATEPKFANVRKDDISLEKIRAKFAERGADEMLREEKFEDCGAAYRAIEAKFSKDADADRWLYNAIVCYRRAGNVTEADATLKRLKKLHPHSGLIKRAENTDLN